MFHWLVVGHIDPRDPVDASDKPYRPKVSRPIPLATAEEALAEFGHDIRQFLSWQEPGFVVCDDTLAAGVIRDRVGEFAYFLAERERAVVMTEAFVVEWTPEARQVQQLAWAADAEPGAAADRGR
ncbi:MAG: hypothetical protein C0501_30470, partial [Isosphaera sp.]|nr:hypothetical protein [Isosphaera sp.]